MSQILNIAGYRFVPLENLPELRENFLTLCQSLELKGTILLSPEGINVSLAGNKNQIIEFITALDEQSPLFSSLSFHQTYSSFIPFTFLKIKIKKEIITLRQPEVAVYHRPAPSISPYLFKHWLDGKRDILILDTRNKYEVKFGTFNQATHLNLNDFSEFPEVCQQLPRSKPIVMFCTGGIRCEKAAHYLLNQGFQEVYQLQGGILGYFAAHSGSPHYHGDCFIFDDRIALNAELKPATVKQCPHCQDPIQPSLNIDQLLCRECFIVANEIVI